MINLTIDGIQVTVPKGSTILQAAAQAGIRIPTLCWHPDQAVKANCRICVCEVEGNRLLQAACSTPVTEGMVVKSKTPKVIEARTMILELILSNHPQDCLNCIRNQNCELQDLAAEYFIRDNPFEYKTRGYELDRSTPSIVRDQNKCVLCRRCIDACSVTQSVYALGLENRGVSSMVVPTMGEPLIESPCVMCGYAFMPCPVGAIYENEQIDELLAAIADPDKVVVTQIAPAVRVALGEEIGMATGELPMEVLVGSAPGRFFDYVLHTNFTADLPLLKKVQELAQETKRGWNCPCSLPAAQVDQFLSRLFILICWITCPPASLHSKCSGLW